MCPAKALTEPPGPMVGGDSVAEDAEHYGAGHSRGDRATIGHVGVHHNDGKHNAGQTPGTEPAHKELTLGAHAHTGEDQKNR